MRLLRLVALVSLAVSLAACAATPTTPPTTGVGGTPSAPSGGGASVSASAGAGGGTAGDITGLALTPTVKMCTLLTTDEAKGIVGKDIKGTPGGILIAGLGTNCIWQTDDTMAPGTFIKVEINPVTYKANTDIMTLGGSSATQFTVGGFDASGVDVGGIEKDASMVIKLDPVKAVSMLIQAPTLDMAKAVADKVLGRLATLK
jgi:hypothetical protein